MKKSKEALGQEFEAVYRKTLYELEHPKRIELAELQRRIDAACRKIGLPPITFYMVDRNTIDYAPVDGIVRQTSFPEPDKIDRELDIGYFMQTRPWGKYARDHLEFCVTSKIEVDLDEVIESEYWSIASFSINSVVFDHTMERRFRTELKRRKLRPDNVVGDFGKASIFWTEEDHRREAAIKKLYKNGS